MAVIINFTIITKNYAADLEKKFLTKSISKPNGSATAMPIAWESKLFISKIGLWILEGAQLTAIKNLDGWVLME